MEKKNFAQEVGARNFLPRLARMRLSSLAGVPVDPDGNNSRQK